MLFSSLLPLVEKAVNSNLTREEKLLEVCKILFEKVPHYNWVGIYFVSGEKLGLGPYVGEPTKHVRIKFGEGICGQAAITKDVFVVQDVSKESNYLSCSPKVKSEIVLPIFKNGEFVGELDIDSHHLSPFTHEDEEFLREVSSLISSLF